MNDDRLWKALMLSVFLLLPGIVRGAKALGECPVISPAPALRNAVLDATGIAFNRLPLYPQSVFERFRGDREGTLWYYRSLARLFGALVQDEPSLDPGFRAMIRELRETVAGLEG